MLSLSAVIHGVLFCAASVGMTLANKAASKALPYTYLLTATQAFASVLVIVVYLKSCGGGSKLTFNNLISWLPAAFLFSGCLFSSMEALRLVSVATMMVFRNANAVLVAIAERIVWGKSTSAGSTMGMLVCVAGTVVYGLNDLTFDQTGYFWCTVNVLFIASNSMLVKHFNSKLSLAPWDMSLANNIEAACMLPLLGAISGNLHGYDFLVEFKNVFRPPYTFADLSIVMSMMLSTFLSVMGMKCQSLFSVTAYVVLNNFNKLPALVLGALLFDENFNRKMIIGVLLSAAGAFIFSLSRAAPAVEPTDEESQIPTHPEPESRFKKQLLLGGAALLGWALFVVMLTADVVSSPGFLKTTSTFDDLGWGGAGGNATMTSLKDFGRGGYSGNASTTLTGLMTTVAAPTAAAAYKDTLAKAKELIGGVYKFWSTDHHISPIYDLKQILVNDLGMVIVDKSLSGHCEIRGTCQTDLRIGGDLMTMTPCPSKQREYFNIYKDDPEMRSMDALMCHHTASMCEAYMPFNKSLIVVVSTRYEIGRWDAERWKAWNQNLVAIANNPRNLVAANNVYDAEYVNYFTGLTVPVLPNYCGYTGVFYSPTEELQHEILIGPGRDVGANALRNLRAAFAKTLPEKKLIPIRDKYPHFEYSDLVGHPAIILVPYQVSVMSLFEYYRMEIPLFVASKELMAGYIKDDNLMAERTWVSYLYQQRNTQSYIEKHPDTRHPYDPNDDVNYDAILYWVQFADFYMWPHITTYSSAEDLAEKYAKADLKAISAKMREYNAEVKTKLIEDWSTHIHRMFDGIPPAAQVPRPQIDDYDQALRAHYGITQSRTECAVQKVVSAPSMYK